ncbi:MAG TPA: hypothetical protein VFW86_02920 [Candidatus Limnocylindrales bacterium]|nr:hypothetical protein [Candidatus Limnocylindrales bacterium]
MSELLAPGASELLVRPRTFVFRFRSAEAFTDFFRQHYGPVHTAFAALDVDGQEALARDLTELATGQARTVGTSIAIPGEYLEVLAMRA